MTATPKLYTFSSAEDLRAFDNKPTVAGVLDYHADDLAYGTAGVIAKSLARAYERVYRSFIVQYSEPGGKDKYKSVEGVSW